MLRAGAVKRAPLVENVDGQEGVDEAPDGKGDPRRREQVLVDVGDLARFAAIQRQGIGQVVGGDHHEVGQGEEDFYRQVGSSHGGRFSWGSE